MKYRTTTPIIWPNKSKVCPSCHRRKPATHKYFGPDKDGRICWCRTCINKRTKKWTKENNVRARLRQKEWNLLKRYGISIEEYNLQLEKQGNACAICRVVKKLHVDHSHSTGKFRGLLCFECNSGLGNMKDDPNLLRAGALYLETGR